MNRYTENSRSNLSNATYRIIAVITIIVSVIGLLMSRSVRCRESHPQEP
jgi:hypothetical protein